MKAFFLAFMSVHRDIPHLTHRGWKRFGLKPCGGRSGFVKETATSGRRSFLSTFKRSWQQARILGERRGLQLPEGASQGAPDQAHVSGRSLSTEAQARLSLRTTSSATRLINSSARSRILFSQRVTNLLNPRIEWD